MVRSAPLFSESHSRTWHSLILTLEISYFARMSLAQSDNDSTDSSPDLGLANGGRSSGNGVGLSNPQLAHGRRTMLDLVNRLHSTGSVIVGSLFLSI